MKELNKSAAEPALKKPLALSGANGEAEWVSRPINGYKSRPKCQFKGKLAFSTHLFMQNEPNLKTRRNFVSPLFLKPNTSSLKPVLKKNEPKRTQFSA